jgi:oxygen-independent coproporphyrinogen III oxidase
MSSEQQVVDATGELILKYNQPGPRYTSYPTALQFGAVDVEAHAADVAAGRGPLSLYYHLPYCESLCWFCACTTVITRNHEQADDYLTAIEAEMDLYRGLLAADRPVEQVHLGGGSPSFLEPHQLERLGKALHSRFQMTDDAELSVELDPRTLDQEKVRVLAEYGFRRASFGVQDVNPAVQKAVHRIQPDAMNRQTLGWVRAAGFTSVNVDLIYGLPLQTVDSFLETVRTVLTYDPDRLAVFSYAHVPWVAPAQKILERSTLPDPRAKLAMLRETIALLTDSGYDYIGMDHFAKRDDELAVALRTRSLRRNFQGYSTRSGSELCGFGMSSISQSANGYRQNLKSVPDYYAQVRAGRLPVERGYFLTRDDHIRRAVIMAIMCDGGLNLDAVSATWHIDARQYFAREWDGLANLEQDGLLARSGNEFRLTELGRLLMRVVAMRFDAHLRVHERRHAKTI